MEDYIGTIIPWPMNWAPLNYMLCNGQLLSISEYNALYSLLGTLYGGDGTNTFGLPDLRGRIPVGVGTNPSGSTYIAGSYGGAETVSLNANELPIHSHIASMSVKEKCSTSGGTMSANPQNNYVATPSPLGPTPYNNTANDASFMQYCDTTVNQVTAGASAPHNNMPPYLTINYIICVNGTYPEQQ